MNSARKISVLRDEISREYGEDYMEGSMSGVVVALISYVIKNDTRRRFSDPLSRCEHIASHIVRYFL